MPKSPANPEDDDDYYRAVLHDLIERGHALARSIQERATSATPDAEDPTIPFDRIARAIRRTIALARHIATNPAATPGLRQNARATARATARTRIIRDVEDAIHCYPLKTGKQIDAAALYAELHERLDDPALEDDLANRPVEDIIADICQDLNVAAQGRSFVFKRRTPPDIGQLRTMAAAPSRPGPIRQDRHGLPAPMPSTTPPAASEPDHPPRPGGQPPQTRHHLRV